MRTPLCTHGLPLTEGEPSGDGTTRWRCVHGCVWTCSPTGGWRKVKTGIPPSAVEEIERRSRAMSERYGLR